MIGGHLGFGIGWWGANQSGSSSGNSCSKILWDFLAGKSCKKFLWENLAGNGVGEKANLRKAVIGGNLVFGIGWWGANQSGSSTGKSCRKILWENLAGNCCGKILQENFVGNSCGKILREILWENLVGKFCRKILWEIVAGKSGGKWRRGKSQLKKGSDWWKFSICNRVMGSQPIRIQLRKILQENLVGKSCRKFLQEILVGKWRRGKPIQEKQWLVEIQLLKYCDGEPTNQDPVWENLAGKFSGKILQEIVAGKSYRKFLWGNLVENSCKK